MALGLDTSDTSPWQTALYMILYTFEQEESTFWPNAWGPRAGMDDADRAVILTGYAPWKKNKQARGASQSGTDVAGPGTNPPNVG